MSAEHIKSCGLSKTKGTTEVKKKKRYAFEWVLRNVQDRTNPEECGELQAKPVHTEVAG